MASITDDNILVLNQGKNPLVNFNFMLRVELAFDLPCKSVRAFQRELEYDFIQEGGLNDYVHMRRKPISKPFTLEVERYVGVDYIDPLPLGADLVLPVMLFVSRSPKRPEQFIPGVVARTYVFTGCTVMKKTYGDLVADQSGLLVETTTLGYREMLCIDLPWNEESSKGAGTDQAPSGGAATVEDKSAATLKALGQNYYEQAKTAKERSDNEYAEKDAETLMQELETVVKKLKVEIEGGSLLNRKLAAEQAMTGKDGKTLEEIAQESRAAERQKEAVAKESERDWHKKDSEYRDVQSRLDDLKLAADELEKTQAGLKTKLDANKKQCEQLEKGLPEEIRSVEAAQTELEQAKEKHRELQDKLRAAEKAYHDLRKKLEDEKLREEARKKPEKETDQTELEDDRQGEESTQTEQNIETEESEAALPEDAAAGTSEDEKLEADDNLDAEIEEKPEEEKELTEEEKNLEELRKAMETAQRECTDAKTALDKADRWVKENKDLVRKKEEIKKQEKELKELEPKVTEAKNKVTPVESEVKTVKAPADAAETKYQTDRAAWEQARQQSEKDRDKASAAEKELNEATSDFNKAKKQINPLQNSLINLKGRKENTKKSQEDCTKQHDQCKEYNDALQKLADDPVELVNDQYEKVKKTAKQAIFHERQVRDTQQHMIAARDLLEEVKPLISQKPEGT